jgi:2,7-dihydroxy-5-methyl-1-naphthoate 7-O-methyltransferase
VRIESQSARHCQEDRDTASGPVGSGHHPDATAEVFRLADAIWPHAVKAAATLRLADRISAGICQVEELADDVGADPAALRRLLAYLVAHGVFTEPAPGVFGLNPAARLLSADHPAQLQARFDQAGLGGRLDRAAAELVTAVRTGGPVYPEVFGRSYYDDIGADPALFAEFDRFARWYTARTLDRILGYGWSRVGVVVDVGGGSGMLLTRILQANPHLRGVLVDLPGTAAQAERGFAAAGLADRCQAVEGSFFDPLPADGDVYLLSGVLLDWPDRDAVAILRRCGDAAGERGVVLVAEQRADDAAGFTDEDLRMLVLVGGRARTEQDFDRLAAAAGLVVRSARRDRTGVSLVELVSG